MAEVTAPATIYEYTVVLEPAEPEGYGVYVPALPGVITVGDTVDEALANARDAIHLHLEGMREDGEDIPWESVPLAHRVRVEL